MYHIFTMFFIIQVLLCAFRQYARTKRNCVSAMVPRTCTAAHHYPRNSKYTN